jgi:oxaloacetate decarboxylase beta subunit
MTFSFIDTLQNLVNESGFTSMSWQQLAMLGVSCVLVYLAIVKKF